MKTLKIIICIFAISLFHSCDLDNGSAFRQKQIIKEEWLEFKNTGSMPLAEKVVEKNPGIPPCSITPILSNKKQYYPFRDEIVKSRSGYGIYYDRAKFNIEESRTNVSYLEASNTLSIEYDLSPYYPWGNFVSFRREFGNPVDLTQCDGFELSIKVVKPSKAKLRITLADVTKKENTHGDDELWWGDLSEHTLEATGDWKKIRIPLDEFFLSYGYGTRQNNHQKDFDKITGYEINVVSELDVRVRGEF